MSSTPITICEGVAAAADCETGEVTTGAGGGAVQAATVATSARPSAAALPLFRTLPPLGADEPRSCHRGDCRGDETARSPERHVQRTRYPHREDVKSRVSVPEGTEISGSLRIVCGLFVSVGRG